MKVLFSFYPYLDPTNKLQPRIFGCVSFVHDHSNGKGKLDPRGVKSVFFRILNHKKGYKCYHPPSKILCQEMSPSMNKGSSSRIPIFRGRI